MIETIETTQNICDICRKYQSYEKCTGCGIDICPDCKKVFAKYYRHSIDVSGSGDAIYCDECQEALKANGDEKFDLYVKMDELITSYDSFIGKFRAEARKLEEEILKYGT